MCLELPTKHTYIYVKEGIKYSRTFNLCVTACDGSLLLQVSIRKISQMALLFHLYFLVGSRSGNRYDSNAFLFSLVNKPGWAPVKLPQAGKYSYIEIYASSNRNSNTNLGHEYSPPSEYSYGSTFTQTFLAGTYTFTPDEIETFYETT